MVRRTTKDLKHIVKCNKNLLSFSWHISDKTSIQFTHINLSYIIDFVKGQQVKYLRSGYCITGNFHCRLTVSIEIQEKVQNKRKTKYATNSSLASGKIKMTRRKKKKRIYQLKGDNFTRLKFLGIQYLNCHMKAKVIPFRPLLIRQIMLGKQF